MSKAGEFLRKRAQEFWERGREDLEKERFNLTALDIEQAIQLWLKYLIFKKAGDYPKTHNFDVLIRELSEIYDLPEAVKFYQEFALQFRMLEDSYITSRYLAREFTKEEAEKIIEFAHKIIKFFEERLNEKLV